MASSSSQQGSRSTTTGSVSSNANDEERPLWGYVDKVSKPSVGGGNWVWKCKYCNQVKQGTYTRVKAHLLKISNKGIAVCKKVSSSDISEMKKLDEDFIAKSPPERTVSLPCNATDSGIDNSDSSKKRKIDDTPIGKSYDVANRNILDCHIARMFYTAGLPFSLAKNPSFIEAFTYASKGVKSESYVPPGYNKLRTTLLEAEKKNVDQQLQPIRDSWPAKGVTIVTDGWSDPQRRPLINFMVYSEMGPMFIKAVNCAGEVKDKQFISNLMKEVIDEVGHQNVVQVVTDNARNCKGAGEIIEGIYPHIYWTPRVVHTLNLALKNICAAKNVENNLDTYAECHWITEIHNDVVQIKNFIMNHGMRLSIYSRFSSLKLLSVAETRFASIVIMLKRFRRIKSSLENMVVCDQWTSYREDNQDKAKFVRDTILDEEWWVKVDYILAITTPIYDVIRACDTDNACLHLVYEMWDSMIDNVKKVIYEHEDLDEFQVSPLWVVVHSILVARWAKSNTPLHCLAHSLHPKYYSREWLDEKPARLAPHRDNEISMERKKCFQRLYPDLNDYDKVVDEYAEFSLELGPFCDLNALRRRFSMDPIKWWGSYGSSAPLLQTLAMRLLRQPTSSSCCERNWSTYSFIHSLKRNKLTPKRAEDLVFVHNNLRLLSRNTKAYVEGKSKIWDVGGDEFGSLEDTGVLEFANLSLDEPEMEDVLLQDIE